MLCITQRNITLQKLNMLWMQFHVALETMNQNQLPFVLSMAIVLTDISRSPTGRGHDAMLFHLREAEITDHDLGVFIRAVVEQILWLKREYRSQVFICMYVQYMHMCFYADACVNAASLYLEIAVYYAVFVQVADRLQHLFDNLASIHL